MLLELSKIQSPRERFDFTWPPTALDTSDDEFDVAEPITLRLEVQKAGPGARPGARGHDKFRLLGRATTTLEVSCSRCAEPFRIPVDVPFDLFYLPQSENDGEGEREVQEEDLSTSFYRGEAIDLGELLREQFYLALPMKPLCTEACKGLCPQCGTNLNRGACDCKNTWEDPRLAGLKALLESEKKD
jgi:uncharacterized protein